MTLKMVVSCGPRLRTRWGNDSYKDERECPRVVSANDSSITKSESFSISLGE